jgi:uncharacterized membrane protein
MHPVLIYLICIITFMIADAPYLFLNYNLYKKKTNSISGKGYTKRYYSAVLVYLALALGVTVLVLPLMNITSNMSIQNRIKNAVIYGGVFGLASYGTFDFTMHFMFEGWTLGVSIMDSIWGAILCSIVAFVISYL